MGTDRSQYLRSRESSWEGHSRPKCGAACVRNLKLRVPDMMFWNPWGARHPRHQVLTQALKTLVQLGSVFFFKCSQSSYDLVVQRMYAGLVTEKSKNPVWATRLLKKFNVECKTLLLLLKPGQNKKGQKKFQLHRFLNTFIQLAAEKKYSKNGAAGKIFGPSYFDPALVFLGPRKPLHAFS